VHRSPKTGTGPTGGTRGGRTMDALEQQRTFVVLILLMVVLMVAAATAATLLSGFAWV